MFHELIDTLWNVNKDAKKVILEYSGINRYIMECKFAAGVLVSSTSKELIDTLWNVNN